jgi:hypothetical protein
MVYMTGSFRPNEAFVLQNTEGEYSGLEHQVTDGVVESLKVSQHLLLFLQLCTV